MTVLLSDKRQHTCMICVPFLKLVNEVITSWLMSSIAFFQSLLKPRTSCVTFPATDQRLYDALQHNIPHYSLIYHTVKAAESCQKLLAHQGSLGIPSFKNPTLCLPPQCLTKMNRAYPNPGNDISHFQYTQNHFTALCQGLPE